VRAARIVECACRERRGDLAGAGAAHAVRDREQRRLGDVRVLVVLALAARIGADLVLTDAERGHVSDLRAVPPTRTTAPGARRRSGVGGIPFRRAPLVEPMSSTYTPSRRASKRACRLEAYSSRARGTSLLPPRPTVSGRESSSTTSPCSRAGLVRTTRRPRSSA